jgi:hypothetical protein
MLPSRNEPQGFAKRAKKNTDFIYRSKNAGEDVHTVTQSVISLLAILVFPLARGKLESLRSVPEDGKTDDPWPILRATGAQRENYYCHILNMRRALAHGRTEFLSDSRNANEVSLRFSNGDWTCTLSTQEIENLSDRILKHLIES